MQTRINEFIATNSLDESVSESLIELVNGCFSDYVSHMSKEWVKDSVPTKPSKKAAATKSEKLESVADAESMEQLKSASCTSAMLNDYCRENKLRIGGSKNDVASRVWRHLHDEQTDDDVSPRSKPKKVVAKKEKHQCFSCNAKGQPCGIAADNEFEGEWFCYRHIDNAEDIIDKRVVELSESTKASSSKKTTKKGKAPVVSDEEEREGEKWNMGERHRDMEREREKLIDR